MIDPPGSQPLRRALALRPSRAVVAPHDHVTDARIDHHELGRRWQRDVLVRERRRVEKERSPVAGEADSHLIHHADARAHERITRSRQLASHAFRVLESEPDLALLLE